MRVYPSDLLNQDIFLCSDSGFVNTDLRLSNNPTSWHLTLVESFNNSSFVCHLSTNELWLQTYQDQVVVGPAEHRSKWIVDFVEESTVTLKSYKDQRQFVDLSQNRLVLGSEWKWRLQLVGSKK